VSEHPAARGDAQGHGGADDDHARSTHHATHHATRHERTAASDTAAMSPRATDTGSPDSAAPDMAATGARAASNVDPYAAQPRRGFLAHLNPIAKIAGPLPITIAVVFTRDLLTPAIVLVAALLLLLAGARLRPLTVALLLVATPVLLAVFTVSFGVWADPAGIDQSSPGASTVLVEVGDWRFTLAALIIGLATALRVGAVLMLSLVAGVSTTGPELVRALVQNLRVPYRIGYTALAALRFVPRFRSELEVIRAARRVRGVDHGRGPGAWFRRTIGLAIPLLAGAIRHAERVALAMDARAFGAHPTRTERTISRWRVRDSVFVMLSVVAALAVAWSAATR
jgi:energy-coupling factor transport system permease protein